MPDLPRTPPPLPPAAPAFAVSAGGEVRPRAGQTGILQEPRLPGRRRFLTLAAAGLVTGTGAGVYALAEPWRLTVAHYRLAPPGWPHGLRLKLAVLADIHACDPWMSAARLRAIAAAANALAPDLTLLLGDYMPSHRMAQWSRPVPDWAEALAGLSAPLGVHAVLGNHDWWADPDAQRRKHPPVAAGLALEAAGIPVYENMAVRLHKNGRPFWLAGLGDQWAWWRQPRTPLEYRFPYVGTADLPGTLAQVTDTAPVILMAHEPDVFPEVPFRVSLTLAGHTHGGQVRITGFAPAVPSRYGTRYIHGHIAEEGRHMIVSAGLGVSGFPVRFGVPPEIVIVELEGSGA